MVWDVCTPYAHSCAVDKNTAMLDRANNNLCCRDCNLHAPYHEQMAPAVWQVQWGPASLSPNSMGVCALLAGTAGHVGAYLRSSVAFDTLKNVNSLQQCGAISLTSCA